MLHSAHVSSQLAQYCASQLWPLPSFKIYWPQHSFDFGSANDCSRNWTTLNPSFWTVDEDLADSAHTFLSVRPLFIYLRKNIFKKFDCSLWSQSQNPASKDSVMFFFTADILSRHSRKSRGVTKKAKGKTKWTSAFLNIVNYSIKNRWIKNG